MWDMYEAWFYQISKIAKKRKNLLLGYEVENEFTQLDLFENQGPGLSLSISEENWLVQKVCNPEELFKLNDKQLEVYITSLYLQYEIEDKYVKEDLDAVQKMRKSISPQELALSYQKKGIRFVSQKDAEYPTSLHNIEDKPNAIYVLQNQLSKKRFDNENLAPVVAIIGARECSEYGAYVARELGKLCASYGIHVVSGLAYGIDGISQKAARKKNGLVTAVLGSGVDVCYPPSNQELYDDLAIHGRIISEYFPGTQPISRNFPPRNRIISGLADAVIVVEAKKKSGTLITVDMALEQGKDVYVVPGRLTDPMSYGCNRLIGQGASVLYDMETVLEEIRLKVLSQKVSSVAKKADNHLHYVDKNADGIALKEKRKEKNAQKEMTKKCPYEPNSFEGMIYKKTSVRGFNVDQIFKALSKERDVNYQQLVMILLQMEMEGTLLEEGGRYSARQF